MEHIFKDENYCTLVNDILDNKDFIKTDNIEHHGTTRFAHSLRVSYYSYILACKLGLNSLSVARAGLLHDYFMSSEDRTKLERFISTFIHPKYALRNASAQFELSDLEKDIIVTHMFPINYRIPKYAESWLVSFVDKGVGFLEFYYSFQQKFNYALRYVYLFIFLKLH